MNELKRYHLQGDGFGGELGVFEDERGEWVKYEDVQPEITRLRGELEGREVVVEAEANRADRNLRQSDNRDRQVMTATRLQLIQVFETWIKECYGNTTHPIGELRRRLHNTEIKIPDTMVKAILPGAVEHIRMKLKIGDEDETDARPKIPLPEGVTPEEMKEAIPEPMTGVPVTCDGCSVREPWEHRCHERPIMVRGEQYDIECGCAECRDTEDKETNR